MTVRFVKSVKIKSLLSICFVVFVLCSFLFFIYKNEGASTEPVANTTHTINNVATTPIPMDNDTLTWPARESVKKITIAHYKHASDKEPKRSLILSSKEEIDSFFEKLYKLPTRGGGPMVDFNSTVEHTVMNILYEDGRTDTLSIYAGELKARDTSVYGKKEDVEMAKQFASYVDTLLGK